MLNLLKLYWGGGQYNFNKFNKLGGHPMLKTGAAHLAVAPAQPRCLRRNLHDPSVLHISQLLLHSRAVSAVTCTTPGHDMTVTTHSCKDQDITVYSLYIPLFSFKFRYISLYALLTMPAS